MSIVVRPAQSADAAAIEALLVEAARWVDAMGGVMWEEGELDPQNIRAEVAAGQFFVAERDGVPAGAIRFQLEDRLFWPDIEPHESAFVHRLVAGRAHKGQGVSTALLHWAAAHARGLGRRYLRLDCDAHRTRLRELYERFGFTLHSFRQVGAYYVARYEYRL